MGFLARLCTAAATLVRRIVNVMLRSKMSKFTVSAEGKRMSLLKTSFISNKISDIDNGW